MNIIFNSIYANIGYLIFIFIYTVDNVSILRIGHIISSIFIILWLSINNQYQDQNQNQNQNQNILPFVLTYILVLVINIIKLAIFYKQNKKIKPMSSSEQNLTNETFESKSKINPDSIGETHINHHTNPYINPNRQLHSVLITDELLNITDDDYIDKSKLLDNIDGLNTPEHVENLDKILNKKTHLTVYPYPSLPTMYENDDINNSDKT